jgi:hypothetical protein
MPEALIPSISDPDLFDIDGVTAAAAAAAEQVETDID